MTLIQARSFRTDESNASQVEAQRLNRPSSLQAQDEIDIHSGQLEPGKAPPRHRTIDS